MTLSEKPSNLRRPSPGTPDAGSLTLDSGDCDPSVVGVACLAPLGMESFASPAGCWAWVATSPVGSTAAPGKSWTAYLSSDVAETVAGCMSEEMNTSPSMATDNLSLVVCITGWGEDWVRLPQLTYISLELVNLCNVLMSYLRRYSPVLRSCWCSRHILLRRPAELRPLWDTLELWYAGDVHCLTDRLTAVMKVSVRLLVLQLYTATEDNHVNAVLTETSRCMWLREDWSHQVTWWPKVSLIYMHASVLKQGLSYVPWNPTSQDKTWCYNLA